MAQYTITSGGTTTIELTEEQISPDGSPFLNLTVWNDNTCSIVTKALTLYDLRMALEYLEANIGGGS